MRLSLISLFLVILLTGFNAGIGFGNAVGYMPGFEDTPAAHALSYWQNADHYFRTRMPAFGNIMLLSLVLAIIFQSRNFREVGYWLLVCALCFSIGDLIVILTLNLPLNETMQKLDPAHVNVGQFESLRRNALKAYHLRSFLTIGAFVLANLGALSLTRKVAVENFPQRKT